MFWFNDVSASSSCVTTSSGSQGQKYQDALHYFNEDIYRWIWFLQQWITFVRGTINHFLSLIPQHQQESYQWEWRHSLAFPWHFKGLREAVELSMGQFFLGPGNTVNSIFGNVVESHNIGPENVHVIPVSNIRARTLKTPRSNLAEDGVETLRFPKERVLFFTTLKGAIVLHSVPCLYTALAKNGL